MKSKLITTLKEKSTYGIDNLKSLERAIQNNEPITFYSWECPPRQIIRDTKNGKWVTFDVDIKGVVNGKMLDKYTEIPRLILQSKEEKWFMTTVLSTYENASYIKIIADTNAKYLYIKSYEILGEKKIQTLSKTFKTNLETKAKELWRQKAPKFYLYTEFQEKLKDEYEMFYNYVYKSFQNGKSKLVEKDISKAWYKCMFNHIGYSKTDKSEREDVMKRAIASYAAEGMLFEMLKTNRTLPNPIWVNWEETPNLSKASNILRKRYGLDELPIIYFMQKEEI